MASIYPIRENQVWRRAKIDLVFMSVSRPEIEFFEFDPTMGGIGGTTWLIQGLWGETIYGVENLQQVQKGDFVCRKPDNHDDVWVMRRSLFLTTYSILGEDF